MKIMNTFWLTLGMSLACLVPVQAAAPEAAFAPYFIQQTNKHTTAFLRAEQRLRDKDDSAWSDEDQQRYLSNALWAVYSAVFTYSLLHGELPARLENVVDEGLLAVWPGNPYNGWLPMQVSQDSEFAAGELLLQLCPPDHYSIAADGQRDVPLSFELAITGPSVEFAAMFGNAVPAKENLDWASTPAGALYMIGAWTESATSMRKKADVARAALANRRSAEGQAGEVDETTH